jgi:NAD(P)-dependent dehydrogenase (short-subunit alcohol dehydrogenase family)
MNNARKWTTNDIPNLTSKVAIVTGANIGIGLDTARELARKGATVILACRKMTNATTAIAGIRGSLGSSVNATLDAVELDLASLASVRAFASSITAKYNAVDILCNNAGVMALPYRKTADGFEMQFGTNHLGHFALTGLLFGALRKAKGSRVVTVSSMAHRTGRIAFDDLQGTKHYGKWSAYAQSKLANLLFAYEFQRRIAARGFDMMSVACHPGYAATNLQFAGPRLEGSKFGEKLSTFGNRFFAQDAAKGALPTLYACVEPNVRGGEFIGPDGFLGVQGHPKVSQSNARSHEAATAARLFQLSEELTAVRFEGLCESATKAADRAAQVSA